MSQPALIDSIIKMLGLQQDSKKHRTPAVHPPLQPYKNHPKSTKSWSYRSGIDSNLIPERHITMQSKE
eukprot:2125840-Ditylum_brightwellii.AAC.1